jgi:hypothetical protein
MENVMELVNTIMGKRQRKYRATYRERVAGWYNGWLHVMIIYLAGSIALYIYGANTVNVQWWEWLALPFGFVSYQTSEYILHMYVMHRPRTTRRRQTVTLDFAGSTDLRSCKATCQGIKS